MTGVATTLHQRFLHASGEAVDRPALHFGDETWTYGQLERRCRSLAAATASLTERGDRVAMVAWNGPWWIEAYLGVPMAGRILALVSPRLTIPELRGVLDTADARLVVIDERVVQGDVASLGASGRTVVGLADWQQMIDAAAPHTSDTGDVLSPAPTDTAWLTFTSGTTGRPKAAALTHANLLGAIDATRLARPIPTDDVYLFPFPLWHIAGYNVLSRLVAGRTVILQSSFDPARIVADADRHGATSMSLAATMLASLLDAAESDPAAVTTLRVLREVHYGAAPMPAELLRRALSVLDVDMWQGYGMTELSGNAVFLSADDHRRALNDDPALLRAAGRAAPGVEVRIVAGDGSISPTGAVGEIEIRAPQVMSGYWNDAAATTAVLSPDGWLRTGDLGTLDASGLLSVVDRKKDIIITGGENVSAREVEEVLREHPHVADVAVVGVPDPRWGKNVCAVVVTREADFDVEALRAMARERLAGFKVPRHVCVVDHLPVNPAGKVVKAEIRTWLAQEPDRLGPRLA